MPNFEDPASDSNFCDWSLLSLWPVNFSNCCSREFWLLFKLPEGGSFFLFFEGGSFDVVVEVKFLDLFFEDGSFDPLLEFELLLLFVVVFDVTLAFDLGSEPLPVEF